MRATVAEPDPDLEQGLEQALPVESCIGCGLLREASRRARVSLPCIACRVDRLAVRKCTSSRCASSLGAGRVPALSATICLRIRISQRVRAVPIVRRGAGAHQEPTDTAHGERRRAPHQRRFGRAPAHDVGRERHARPVGSAGQVSASARSRLDRIIARWHADKSTPTPVADTPAQPRTAQRRTSNSLFQRSHRPNQLEAEA